MKMQPLWTPPTSFSVAAGALAPDGLRAATAEGHQVRLRSMETGEVTDTLGAGLDRLLSLLWSGDGKNLWAGSDSADEGITLWHWNLDSGQRQGRGFQAHYRTTALAWGPYHLLSGGGEDDGTWILWSLPDMSVLARSENEEGEVLSVALSPHGFGVLQTSEAGLAVHYFWLANPARPAWRCPVAEACQLIFSPDGQLLYALSESQAVPISVSTGKANRPLRGPGIKASARGVAATSSINGETFGAAQTVAASGRLLSWRAGTLEGWQGKRRLWSQGPLSGPLTALTCQPGLPYLAGARGSQILLWDYHGQLRWKYELPAPCYRLALDARGRWLAVPGEPFLYLNLSDGSPAHQGPENFAAGTGAFGQGQIFPEFRPWVTQEENLWSPVIANFQEWGVLWSGQAVHLRTGLAGPRYEGFPGQPGHITVAEHWVALANDSLIGVFGKEGGHLRSLVQARGNANSGVAYNERGDRALRATLHHLQAWDLAANQVVAQLDTATHVTSVAGCGPYFAGDSQGQLFQVDGI